LVITDPQTKKTRGEGHPGNGQKKGLVRNAALRIERKKHPSGGGGGGRTIGGGRPEMRHLAGGGRLAKRGERLGGTGPPGVSEGVGVGGRGVWKLENSTPGKLRWAFIILHLFPAAKKEP